MARTGPVFLAFAFLLLAAHDRAVAKDAESQGGRAFPPRDGLILRDGTVVPGTVEEIEDGRFRATPEKGEGVVFEPHQVAVALRAGEVVYRGLEGPVRLAWRRQLAPAVVKAHEALHKLYVRARLYSDGLRVMEEAIAWGLPEARFAKARKKLGKRSDRNHAERKRAALAPDLVRAREPMIREFRDAATWCAENGLVVAASGLLGDAMGLTPDSDDLLAQVASLIPAGFPWREDPDAARRWLEWAPVLAPVEASWVPPDSPVRATLTAEPWSRADTLVIRTRNLLLLSRSADPEIVGTCLRNGEAAIQAIEDLLGFRYRTRNRWDHLEVRLHSSRAECESTATKPARGRGPAPPPSDAGGFSPGHGASMLFLPESKDRGSILGSLSETTAHEITHHYLATRWRSGEGRGRYSVTTPGFWCVEGIAEFIDGQVDGRIRTETLDAADESSLEIVKQLARKSALLPLSKLLSMSQWDLKSFSTVSYLKVELGGRTVSLDRVDLFHAQAAALTFFLVHERGPDGRKQYADYLFAFYRGKTARDGWRNLGFQDLKPLEEEFAKFIESLE